MRQSSCLTLLSALLFNARQLRPSCRTHCVSTRCIGSAFSRVLNEELKAPGLVRLFLAQAGPVDNHKPRASSALGGVVSSEGTGMPPGELEPVGKKKATEPNKQAGTGARRGAGDAGPVAGCGCVQPEQRHELDAGGAGRANNKGAAARR